MSRLRRFRVQARVAGDLCVLDADHAWVTEATSVSNNACAAKGCAGPEIDGLYVMSTVDGGVTWQTERKDSGKR